MSGIKYVCSECDWVSRRKMGNNKPCPKCGGPMSYHEEDRSIVIVTIIAMAVLAVLMGVLTGSW
jgi:uncharacterized paraquat-inducible protein A